MKKVADTSLHARFLFILTRSLSVIISLVLLVLVIYLLLNRSTEFETVKVAVANKDIYSQEIITKDKISFQTYVKDYQPINGISEDKISSVIGKKIYLPVKKGDILNSSLFGSSKDGLTGGIANFIPLGKKLVYIKTDDVHVFSNDLQKENNIDIIAINQKSENVLVIVEKITVFDVIRSQESETNEIIKVGLILSDTQVIKLSEVLTQDWKLNIAIHPQNERDSESSLLKVASDEGALATPTPNEKKDH